MTVCSEFTGLREEEGDRYRSPMVETHAAFLSRGRVVEAWAVERRRAMVLWESGLRESIDLRPVISRLPGRAVAERDLLFRTLRPSQDGHSIVWADGSEIGISWLEDLALAQMTNAEFSAALQRLGFNVEEAAAHLGVSKRSIGGFKSNRAVPRAVAMAVRFLLQRRERGGG